jgi:hypothetical protein
MLEINTKSKLKIQIDGTVYELSKPNVRQVKELQESVKDEQKSLTALLSYFESLGLPLEVAEQLDIESLTKIAEHLNGSKKN